MLDRVVPGEVAVFETREDLIEVELFPEEVASLGRPVEKRRREFVTGRACAREALARLGLPPSPIATGPRGAPTWPAGVVGSITHCRGYRACAAARADDLASLGIDAEVHDVLPEGVLGAVSSPGERRRLMALGGGVHGDRVLFSAKEAVYKAWFPLTGSWLGFEDVDMAVDAADASFSARLLVPGPVVDGRRLTHLDGRWHVEDGLVVTAVVVPR